MQDEFPDIRVGTKLVWRNLSLEQAEQFEDGLPNDFDFRDAEGVVTELTIVGVVRMPMESVASFASDGMLLTSPGWAAAHLDEAPIWFTNAIVRLRNGAADMPALHAGLERVTGRADIPVKDLSTDIKRVQRSLDLERTALLMFAAAIAITALVLVGQAVVRATASGIASVPALRALGATSASLAVGLALPMVVTVASLRGNRRSRLDRRVALVPGRPGAQGRSELGHPRGGESRSGRAADHRGHRHRARRRHGHRDAAPVAAAAVAPDRA